jgi:hypothetical protein
VLRVAQAFYDWCMENDIDPDKFTLVLRANDDMTYARADFAIHRMFDSLDGQRLPTKLKQMKIHGVKVTLSTLDKR